MRRLSFLLVTFLCASTQAHLGQDTGGHLIVGKCYLSFPSGYTVLRKLGDKNYELVGNWMSPHATLQTSSISHDEMAKLKKMGTLNLNLKFLGTKKMEMSDGFEEDVDQWAECRPDDVDTKSAERKSLKNSSCQEACFTKDSKKKFAKGETLESCLQQSCK